MRLDVWKSVWDEFAERLPEAEPEGLRNDKIYTTHNDFRKQQDLFVKEKEEKVEKVPGTIL